MNGKQTKRYSFKCTIRNLKIQPQTLKHESNSKDVHEYSCNYNGLSYYGMTEFIIEYE